MPERLVHNLAAEACTQTVGCVQQSLLFGVCEASDKNVRPAADISGRLKKEAEFIAVEFALARGLDAPAACARCGRVFCRCGGRR